MYFIKELKYIKNNYLYYINKYKYNIFLMRIICIYIKNTYLCVCVAVFYFKLFEKYKTLK